MPQLLQMDKALTDCLESISNVRIEGNTALQIILPVKNGCFGIQLSSIICSAAYLSTVFKSQSVVGLILGTDPDNLDMLNDALAHWQNLAEGVLPPGLNYIQKKWLSPVYTNIQSKISETKTDLLNGVSAPGAATG